MSIESTITDFYASVQRAGELLSTYQKNIDEKQEAIKACVAKISTEDVTLPDGDTEMTKLCSHLLVQHNKAISSWKRMIEKYISGKRFVNQFEKSLLLIVFADVKAGKSTLGNFISGYAFKDTPYEKLYTAPVCYAYDYTDKSLECGTEAVIPEGYFWEDEIQATASIQYFTLFNGLTWVDTPGIHSLTTEYEALAKEYVKYADLILFLTPSNNPVKQDEAIEIRKLVQCDKPLLIAITKSDRASKTVRNGKICTVLAPKTTRAEQECYVEAEIAKIGKDSMISQNRYVSISTKIAKQALAEQDEALFEASNFPAFFEQIGTVISEKAIALKMKRPKDELNAVIDELLHGSEAQDFIGISQLMEHIDNVLNSLAVQSKRMEQLKAMILSDARAEIGSQIYTLLYGEKMAGRLAQKEHISERVGTLVSEILSSKISETFGTEITNFQTVQLEKANVMLYADFAVKTQNLEYQIQEGRERRRDPRGLIEHIQSFFGKEFREYSVKTVTKTKEIQIGDNFNEYAQQVWQELQPQMETLIDAQIADVRQRYFGVLIEKMQEISAKLCSVQQELEQLKYEQER